MSRLINFMYIKSSLLPMVSMQPGAQAQPAEQPPPPRSQSPPPSQTEGHFPSNTNSVRSYHTGPLTRHGAAPSQPLVPPWLPWIRLHLCTAVPAPSAGGPACAGVALSSPPGVLAVLSVSKHAGMHPSICVCTHTSRSTRTREVPVLRSSVGAEVVHNGLGRACVVQLALIRGGGIQGRVSGSWESAAQSWVSGMSSLWPSSSWSGRRGRLGQVRTGFCSKGGQPRRSGKRVCDPGTMPCELRCGEDERAWAHYKCMHQT